MEKFILPQSIEDLGYPITLAFSPDRRVYLSERITGRLWQINTGENRLVHTFPIVPLIGHHETGLIGIVLDPDFKKNSYIYCYYTYGYNEKDFKNRVVRIREYDDHEDIVIDNIPAWWIHNGGIMVFGPDKKLYIGTGVRNEFMEKSLDINYWGGKVLRINPDGSIPEGNPFPDSPVYSYGHRNIFGLAFHPKTGKLYASEEGPDENDEINIIEKGGNYGWPKASGITENLKYINPIKTYTPSIKLTQNVFVNNDLYVGSFKEGNVRKLTLTGVNFDKVEKEEIVYQGSPHGVIGVFYGKDNNFYITTPQSILRIYPSTTT